MKLAVVLTLLSVALVGCKSNKHQVDLSEYPEPSNFLRQEIEDRMAALAYQSDEELYQNMIRIAYIGEPAVPYLVKGLEAEHIRVRGSSAYILGLLKDRRTMPALRTALEDPVPEVRYEAATALGNMGDREGYATLVQGLFDEDIKNRYKCHEALNLITGLDFGYKHDDPPEVRKAAAMKWEAWAERIAADDR